MERFSKCSNEHSRPPVNHSLVKEKEMKAIYNKHPYSLPEEHTLNEPLYIPEQNYGMYYYSTGNLVYAGRKDGISLGVSFEPNKLPEIGNRIASSQDDLYIHDIDHENKKVIVFGG